MTSALRLSVSLIACWSLLTVAQPSRSAETTEPIVGEDLVFAEQDGLLVVEAEHFFEQTKADVRAFHRTTADRAPHVEPDGDPPHVAGASGGAYLEILPDTRRTHNDKLINKENFSPQPGEMAVLHYKVHVATPGRYYVWARTHSTGTEDNGLHVGIDGGWPPSGQRMQWTAKNKWFWDSKQRTQKVHTGVPGQLYLDIDEPGEHILLFSMREDGFEFDKWLMTTDRNFARPEGVGPESQVHAGETPPTYEFVPTRSGNKTKLAKRAKAKEQYANRGDDGDGAVAITGEQKQWHNVTLTLDGPFAAEADADPNPFTDYRMTVDFTHESGTPSYSVPGYFAADGNAANTSATSGTKWRAHLAHRHHRQVEVSGIVRQGRPGGRG